MSAARRMGVGFIGAGWAVRKIHLPFFAARPNIGPRVVVDPSEEAVRAVRELDPQIQVAHSASELAARRDVNVVVVASPSHLHVEHALRCLTMGQAVICEKPVAIDVPQLKQLERHLHPGALFFACTPNRYRADVAALRNMVRRGRIGTPYRIEARWLRARGVPGPSWFRERAKSGGGVLIDLGPHLIDAVLWAAGLGEPRSVTGFVSAAFASDRGRTAAWHDASDNGAGVRRPVEDNASVFLQYERACCAVHLGWAGHLGGDSTEIRIFGDEGSVCLTTVFGFSTDTELASGNLVLRTRDGEESYEFPFGDRTTPHHVMLDDHLTRIEAGSAESRREVTETMRIILKVYDEAQRLEAPHAKGEPHASQRPADPNVF